LYRSGVRHEGAPAAISGDVVGAGKHFRLDDKALHAATIRQLDSADRQWRRDGVDELAEGRRGR